MPQIGGEDKKIVANTTIQTPLADAAALEHIFRRGMRRRVPVGQSASNPVKTDRPGRHEANLPVVLESAVPLSALTGVQSLLEQGSETRGKGALYACARMAPSSSSTRQRAMG